MKSRLALLAACGVLAFACAALGQPSAYRGAGDPAKATDLPSSRLYIPPQGITFKATDFISENVRLTAQWFYAAPNEGKKLPTVIMAHGWGATAASFREDAIDLAKAGYLVMVFDYRGWGDSDGRMIQSGRPPAAGKATGAAQVRELRGYFDPLEQNDDWLNAINYAVTNPMVDADRIGIRGASESGGHVIAIAAQDHRVKALVSDVTGADLRPLAPAAVAEANAAASRLATGQDQYPADRAIVTGALVGGPVGNKLLRWAPVDQAEKVTVPALFVLAQYEDRFSNEDNGQRACLLVKGPRKLVMFPNINHNEIYGVGRLGAITLAIDWFDKYLKPAGAPTRVAINRTEPERGDCSPPPKLEIEGIGAGGGKETDSKDAVGRTGTAGDPPPQDASGRFD